MSSLRLLNLVIYQRVSLACMCLLLAACGGGTGGTGGDTTPEQPPINKATSEVGAPAGRTQHTAVWTGTEMIVWGGYNSLGYLVEGGAYDPSRDAWRLLPIQGAPAGRSFHTAVWSGSEMLIWGGFVNGAMANTGAAYNPSTNQWRTLPTAGAPQARALHTAVWTGSAMVVFGGGGNAPPPAGTSLVFDDGARYDPVLDQWTPIAVGPPAREHTAVWTGSQMLTWGGTSPIAIGLLPLNTGGSYNPSLNSWVLTTQTGVPAARYGHAAAASGPASMVVWGGTSAVQQFEASGGRFDASTNAWLPVASTGAPTARANHTMVTTGTEVVVWGGGTFTQFRNDGAAYNPSTNTWRALAPGFQPVARVAHTAVWTGTSMIVWGGNIFAIADVFLGSGAVIYP